MYTIVITNVLLHIIIINIYDKIAINDFYINSVYMLVFKIHVLVKNLKHNKV